MTRRDRPGNFIRGGRENPRPTFGQYDMEPAPPPVEKTGPPMPPPVDFPPAPPNNFDFQAILAKEICDSQAFQEIMRGACHIDLHIHSLRDQWTRYQSLGGGYGH